MPSTGFIKVAKGLSNRLEEYDLNDGIATVQDALTRFNSAHPDTPIAIENVRINGRVATADQTVRDGDFILVQDEAVQAGGLKGALS